MSAAGTSANGSTTRDADAATDAADLPSADDDTPVTGTGTTDGGTTDTVAVADPAQDRRFPWPTVSRIVGVVLVSAGALAFWRGFQLPGHNSGDDFALYIDQARSMVQGDIGATLGRTRFAVDNSGWSTFSPYAYPWGLPVLLAPVIALTGSVDPVDGIDYGPLKLVVSATFLVGLFAYAAWARRRIGDVGALLLAAFFGLNFAYVLHTDNVLSEFPFLMSVMLVVVWFDRVRERGQLVAGPIWPLVVLGLLVAYAFNVRREGLGALLGVGLGQLAAIWPIAASAGPRWRERAGAVDWRRVATPWTTFVAAVIAFQLALPSELLPRYVERDPNATSGLGRIPDNVETYRPLLAELLGLKDLGPFDTTLFGSSALGDAAMATIVFAAVVGMVVSGVRHPARDLPVIGVFVGVSVLVLSAPFQTYRYIMALVPFLLYFAYVGLAAPLGWVLRRDLRRPMFVPELIVVAMIVAGWGDTANARQYRADWVGPQPGPQEAAALEMFDAVRRETRGDSVIVYNRARTMMLYTQRLAVQGGNIDFIESGGDYYVMYLEPDGSPGDYSQYPLTDDEAAERGFVEIWRNDGWVIWRTPLSRAPMPSRALPEESP